MTDLSAWQWYLVEQQGKSVAEFADEYFQLIEKSLSENNVQVSQSLTSKDGYGMKVITLEVPDPGIRGTITIAIRAVSEKQFSVVVASAVSP